MAGLSNIIDLTTQALSQPQQPASDQPQQPASDQPQTASIIEQQNPPVIDWHKQGQIHHVVQQQLNKFNQTKTPTASEHQDDHEHLAPEEQHTYRKPPF